MNLMLRNKPKPTSSVNMRKKCEQKSYHLQRPFFFLSFIRFSLFGFFSESQNVAYFRCQPMRNEKSSFTRNKNKLHCCSSQRIEHVCQSLNVDNSSIPCRISFFFFFFPFFHWLIFTIHIQSFSPVLFYLIRTFSFYILEF